MSKNNPGKWDPPPKPEEAGLVDSALARIAQGVPNAAYSIAANTAQAAGVEYGTSDIVNAAPAPIHAPGGALSNQRQANFDSIKDDYQYKIASALLLSGGRWYACPTYHLPPEGRRTKENLKTSKTGLKLRRNLVH